MLINLRVVKGPAKGTLFQIVRPGVYVVGRSAKCHFAIPGDEFVSHAQLMIKASPVERNCELRKIPEAPNACYLAGNPVVATELCTGARIEFGFTAIELEIDWDAKIAFHHCCQCGAEVYLLPGHTHTVRRVVCESCAERGPLGDEAAVTSDEQVFYRCLHCGTDLTVFAESDGRGLDLRGAVQYCCDECLPRESRPQDVCCHSRIGSWICLRHLGTGGMGEVLLVRHETTRRLAAIKLGSNQSMRQRFHREMHLLSRFSHPNIVRYIEHVESAEDSYLVMQCVPGGTLDDYLLERGAPLDVPCAVELVAEILSALAYMHCHPEGVFVHRDLKPENILLSFAEDSRPHPVVSDFGLAKNRKGRTRLTRYGIMMGSCGYSPWEQMRDAASATPAADTYSVGVILYYALTGLFPYEYPSPLEVLARARQEGLDVGAERPSNRFKMR